MAKKEDGTIFFDEEEQKKVDEIVKERLSRHKPDDYDDLKEIEKDLEDFGYSGTPAEKKAAIKAYKEEIQKQKELAELEEQAKTTGKDPDLLKEIKELKDELAEIKGERKAQKDAEEQKKKQDEEWKKQVKEFKEKYQDIDLDVLEKDDDFIEYAQGRNGTLENLYDGYVKFTSKLKEKTAEEITQKYKVKELSSTGVGKGGKQDSGDYGLSENQKTLAKKFGMTNKEYAERLKYAD